MPPNEELFRSRVRKETLHELGHTFGLTHCMERECAMSLSIHVRQIDEKREELCNVCRVRLNDKLDALWTEPGGSERSET